MRVRGGCPRLLPSASPLTCVSTLFCRPDALAGPGGRCGPGQGPDLPGQPLRVQRALAGAAAGEGGRGEAGLEPRFSSRLGREREPRGQVLAVEPVDRAELT